MDEILEAEIFNGELDKILAGKAVAADLDPEMAADLAFAARLARLDMSAQSRERAPAKARLLAQASERGLRALLTRKIPGRTVALVAFTAALVAAPFLMKLIAAYNDDRVAMNAAQNKQWGGGSNMFGSGSSPYENGNDTFAAGGAVGGSGDMNQSSLYDKHLAAKAAPGYRGIRGPGNPQGYDGTKKIGSLAGDAFNRSGSALSALNAGAREQIPYGQPLPPADQMAPLPPDTAGYAHLAENAFMKASEHPLSTFSIDVDGASYANLRRILNENRLPPVDAVRVEEMVNYFHYNYPEPEGEHPFSISADMAACPWSPKHKLVRVGLKGRTVAAKDLPPNNLVFLLDTSGSMSPAERLPLIKKGLRLLVEQLRAQDRISIVAYAGSAGLVLGPTSGAKKAEILGALERLQAGGSTAGGEGINLAYKVAADAFMKHGNNRVILATDGDFNVGVTSDAELVRLIEEKREHGVALTVLGVGTDNLQDHKMEQLADKGNGNYAYLDGILEAQKVLVKEMSSTLLTVAKDVKLQVEFNPARVNAYKLIGYENRVMAAEDFNDDKKDAGELGAGHTVTALYEVIPAGVSADGTAGVDELKYARPKPAPAEASDSQELLTVKFRYKKPGENASRLITRPLLDGNAAWSSVSPDFKFAAAVAGFGLLLRESPDKGPLTYAAVGEMAKEGVGADEDGTRAEMVRLVEKARLLDGRTGR